MSEQVLTAADIRQAEKELRAMPSLVKDGKIALPVHPRSLVARWIRKRAARESD